ncbi:MAG: segregation/condensation protein A, partial [Myxococcales bacterium]|nr:segregation/condensation protein A [Myxococcales bacterium]
MSSDTAKGAEGEASSPRGPAPQPSLITPVDEGSNPVYAVELPIFEGPLDLLLHLVRRHELDILDIPIAFVTEKYLEYLEVMRALDIEIAGDYLVMAATLAYLKSRELVPQQDAEEEESDGEDEDGEDPREALIRRLIEYERFRAAGRELNEMPVAGRDVFTRGGSIDLPPLDPGMAPVTLFRLAEAYARVLQRAKISKSHEVVIERVTVRQRMEQLSLLLEERGDVEFDSLFLEREWSSVLELRQMLVVTLMSVLELVKLGIIGVQQPTDTATIRLLRRASYAAAMQALTGYDEDASFGEGAAPKPGEPTPAGGAPTAGAAPQPPPAAPASGSPVARDGDAALGEGRGDGLTDVGSVATRSRVDSAEGIEEREALAALDEEGVEDEPGWGVSAADDAPERHGLAERKGLAEREDELEDGPERRHGSPSEDDLEDRSVQRAFATGGSVESAGLEEREALAETEDELEDELEDGPEWSALEAVDPAERHGLPSAGDL